MNLESRIKNLEEKTGGKDFYQRMEQIFKDEDFEKLTSKDVMVLKKFMPDKFEYLKSELYTLMQANL